MADAVYTSASMPLLASMSQLAHHVKQPGRPRPIQELRTHGNAARVEAGELVDGHDSRLWDGSDRRLAAVVISRPMAKPDRDDH
jgi:hypothetical protein